MVSENGTANQCSCWESKVSAGKQEPWLNQDKRMATLEVNQFNLARVFTYSRGTVIGAAGWDDVPWTPGKPHLHGRHWRDREGERNERNWDRPQSRDGGLHALFVSHYLACSCWLVQQGMFCNWVNNHQLHRHFTAIFLLPATPFPSPRIFLAVGFKRLWSWSD